MAKVNIELGGKYTFGDTINQAQNDLKKFGKETKDAGSIATTALKGVADVAGNDAAKAINGLTSVVSGLATGGLFGMIAAAAGTAFTFIKAEMDKAKEQAKQLAEAVKQALVVGVERIKESIKSIGTESDEGKKKIEELIKVAQGASASDAKIKVAELHVETLQKITDDMSEAGKKSIQAQEAYEASIIKWNAQITANADTQAYMRQRQDQIDNSLYEISNKLFDLKSEESEWAKKNSGQLMRYEGLLQSANTTIEDMTKAGISEAEAVRFHAQRLKEKEEFEKQYVGFVAEYNERQKAVTQATEQQKKLMDEKHQLDLKLAEVVQQETVIRAEAAAAVKDLDRQARLAQEAYAREREEKEIATLLEKESNDLRLDMQKRMAKLNLTQEMTDKLMKVVNDGLEDELEEAEIRDNVEREYRRLREEQNELLEEENKLTEKDIDDKKNNDDKDKNEIEVTLSANASSDIGKEVEEHQNFKDWQKKQREELRKGRNSKNEMKQDLPAMTKALKGEMPKAQADAWVEYAKKKYTPEQMKELANMAQKTELMSTKSKEWHQQQERFRNMLKAMNGEDQASKKRDKHTEETAKNTSEMKTELKRANTLK